MSLLGTLADLVVTGNNLLGTGNQVVVFSGADLVAGRFPGFGATPLANFAVGGRPDTTMITPRRDRSRGDEAGVRMRITRS